MKETFYEKKPTRHMQITAVFGDLQSTGKDEMTQRLTKRQYSPINKKNDTFNRTCDIFRLNTLHRLPVYNILFVPRDLQTADKHL